MNLDPFRHLGETLAERWSQDGYDELRFPALATEALQAAGLHEGFDGSAMLRWLMLNDPGLRQPDGSFGEPPIVVYRGRGFYIEVLYWLDATTDIHSHAFSGAFQVLQGSSIHAVYAFAKDHRVHSTLWFGQARLERVEQLEAGDVRPIEAGEGFIHALFHLARPSVSVVVRTPREDDQLPQLNLLPPHIAYAPFAEDRLRDRRNQALTLMARCDRATLAPILEELAVDGDLLRLFHTLTTLALHVDEKVLVQCTDLAKSRHGELADRLLESLLGLVRKRHITLRRSKVTDPHVRWLLALLLNVPSRAEISRLIVDAGHADPVDTMVTGLATLARTHGGRTTTFLDIEIDHSPGASERVVAIITAVIRGAMRDLSDDAIAELADAAVGGLDADERGGIPQLLQDLRRPASPFYNLFR